MKVLFTTVKLKKKKQKLTATISIMLSWLVIGVIIINPFLT